MVSIVGIDEVGRGCWAGPMVASAVILAFNIEGLKDSKKLSKRQRQHLDKQIRDKALAIGLGWVTPIEIDNYGLTKATTLAMKRALKQILINYDEIIIDGSINFLSPNPKSRALIKADSLIPAVSAASIVAKVARDNYMIKLAKKYPKYGFDEHVGYGTALHLNNLKSFGVSDIHRLSYKPIKLLLNQDIKTINAT